MRCGVLEVTTPAKRVARDVPASATRDETTAAFLERCKHFRGATGAPSTRSERAPP